MDRLNGSQHYGKRIYQNDEMNWVIPAAELEGAGVKGLVRPAAERGLGPLTPTNLIRSKHGCSEAATLLSARVGCGAKPHMELTRDKALRTYSVSSAS